MSPNTISKSVYSMRGAALGHKPAHLKRKSRTVISSMTFSSSRARFWSRPRQDRTPRAAVAVAGVRKARGPERRRVCVLEWVVVQRVRIDGDGEVGDREGLTGVGEGCAWGLVSWLGFVMGDGRRSDVPVEIP
jgi:hypothetical protein